MDYNFISGVIKLYYDGRLVLKQEYYNRKSRSEIFEACIQVMKTQRKKMEIIAIPDPEPKMKVTLDYDVNRLKKDTPKAKPEVKIVKKDPVFIEDEVKSPIVRPPSIYSNRKIT